jgi:predicted protein tyrosine phosphatase
VAVDTAGTAAAAAVAVAAVKKTRRRIMWIFVAYGIDTAHVEKLDNKREGLSQLRHRKVICATSALHGEELRACGEPIR